MKRAFTDLEARGWLEATQKNKHSPIRFTLRNPAEERRQGEVIAARARLEDAEFKGEALMREFLSLLVASDEFQDNATPGFLVNPFTEEAMKYDRYYPPGVAFEFNGPQHYGPTRRYRKEASVRRQQGRDYMKMGISMARDIHLVVVHAQDLALDAMRRKVEGLLPLRRLDDHQPLVEFLESVSRAYRKKAGGNGATLRQSSWEMDRRSREG